MKRRVGLLTLTVGLLCACSTLVGVAGAAAAGSWTAQSCPGAPNSSRGRVFFTWQPDERAAQIYVIDLAARGLVGP